MKYLLPGVFVLIVSYSTDYPYAFAVDDLPARIAHLEKSLVSIEREEAVVKKEDSQARNARANALLAEVRQNIALTIADLRDDRPAPTDQTRTETVRRRIVVHADAGPDDRAKEQKEIELQVVVAPDDRKTEKRDRKRPKGRAKEDRRPEPRPRRSLEQARPSDQPPHAGRGAARDRHQREGGKGHPEPRQLARARHLHEAAKHLAAAARYESMAKKARSDAERLMREARHANVPRRRPHENVHPHVVRTGKAIGELRRDVDQLRKEIEALKRNAREVGKRRPAVEEKKAGESRKAKEAAVDRKKKAEKKRREDERTKKQELEKKRKLERKRREMELEKKREKQREEGR